MNVFLGCLYVQLVFDHTALFICNGKGQKKNIYEEKKWVNNALIMTHYD